MAQGHGIVEVERGVFKTIAEARAEEAGETPVEAVDEEVVDETPKKRTRKTSKKKK